MTAFRWFTALAVAGTLAKHGLGKKSLSKSGAAAAFAVGLLAWGCGVRFGLTLILFRRFADGRRWRPASRQGSAKQRCVNMSAVPR